MSVNQPSRTVEGPLQRQQRRRALVMRQLTGRPVPAPGVPDERRKSAERRLHSVSSMLYGGFRPRRRQLRRAGDHTQVLLDWHDSRVFYLAIAILLMSCADALFTLNLLAVGGEEVNVIMRSLIHDDVQSFLTAKIGLTAVSVVMLVTAAHRHVRGWFSVRSVLKSVCFGYAALLCYELYLLGWEATGVADALLRDALRWLAAVIV
jgi:hypothetical protein